jgi:hypothetical protein
VESHSAIHLLWAFYYCSCSSCLFFAAAQARAVACLWGAAVSTQRELPAELSCNQYCSLYSVQLLTHCVVVKVGVLCPRTGVVI